MHVGGVYCSLCEFEEVGHDFLISVVLRDLLEEFRNHCVCCVNLLFRECEHDCVCVSVFARGVVVRLKVCVPM